MFPPRNDPFPHVVLYDKWEPELLRHCRQDFDDIEWSAGGHHPAQVQHHGSVRHL